MPVYLYFSPFLNSETLLLKSVFSIARIIRSSGFLITVVVVVVCPSLVVVVCVYAAVVVVPVLLVFPLVVAEVVTKYIEVVSV